MACLSQLNSASLHFLTLPCGRAFFKCSSRCRHQHPFFQPSIAAGHTINADIAGGNSILSFHYPLSRPGILQTRLSLSASESVHFLTLHRGRGFWEDSWAASTPKSRSRELRPHCDGVAILRSFELFDETRHKSHGNPYKSPYRIISSSSITRALRNVSPYYSWPRSACPRESRRRL